MLAEPRTCYCFTSFRLDPERRALLASGTPVAIHGRALDLLIFLVEHRDRIVSRDEIFAHVWAGITVSDNNLTVQISSLRRTLSVNGGDAGLIGNYPGRGYRFLGEVEAVPDRVVPSDAKTVIRSGPVAVRRSRRRLAAVVLLLPAVWFLMSWSDLVRSPPPGPWDDRLTVEIEPFTSIGPPALAALAAAYTNAVVTRPEYFGDLRIFRAGQHPGALTSLSGTVEAVHGGLVLSVALVERATGRVIHGSNDPVPDSPSARDLSAEAARILWDLRPDLFRFEAVRRPRPRDALDLFVEAEVETNNADDQPENLDRAIHTATRAVALEPDGVPARLLLSALLTTRFSLSPKSAGDGEGERALSLADGVLISWPGNLVAIENRAIVLVELGRAREAAFCASRGLAIDPDDPVLLATLQAADEEAGRLDEAISLAARADSDSNPTNPAQLAFALGRYADALTEVDRFLSTEPADIQRSLMTLFRAACLVRLGRVTEAGTAVGDAMRALPPAFGHLGALRQTFYQLPDPAWHEFLALLRTAGMAA